MSEVRQLTREEARRIAVRAQLLALPRPGDLLEVVRHLGIVQADPATTVAPWESSGWNNDRSLRMLLDLLVSRGEVAAAGCRGRVPLWDLAARVCPDVPVVPLEEADRILDERRLHALGVARARAAKTPNEPNHVGDAGVPAVVEGVRGGWRVDPDLLDSSTDEPFPGRVVLLSPLDRLVLDRLRMEELFGFDYQLEMFKPAAKRRWGYWAMPILDGDRRAGAVRVNAVHEDHAWSGATRAAVDEEIDALAAWLDLVPER